MHARIVDSLMEINAVQKKDYHLETQQYLLIKVEQKPHGKIEDGGKIN